MSVPAIYDEDVLVSPYDTDFRRAWKPAAMVQAIQRVSNTHADLLGFSYDEMAACNQAWVLSRLKVRFYEMPVTGDRVTIRSAPRGVRQKIFFMRDNQLTNQAGKVVATATTAWLLIDMTTWRMLLPSRLSIAYPQVSGLAGLDEDLDKIPIPEGLAACGTAAATYNTVDIMGHVNNTRYVEWVTDCFSLDHYRTHHLDWLQINYANEVKPGEQVSLLAGAKADDPSLWLVQGVARDNGRRYFEAAVGWSRR